MIRLSGLTIRASAPRIWISREVFTLFTDVCLCLVLRQTATGFCTGQTEPGTSSYLIQKKCSWNECICRKGVFISNNWHFVMTVALAKSSWPSLIFIENFIECFLLLVCVSFSLLRIHTCKTRSSKRSQSHLRLLHVKKCNANCGAYEVCVIIRHRNSSPASEFKEVRLKLWDRRSLFLEFYILFLKTPWKA